MNRRRAVLLSTFVLVVAPAAGPVEAAGTSNGCTLAISGTPAANEVLTATYTYASSTPSLSNGGITWLRRASAGGTGMPVGTGPSYVPAVADIGFYVDAKVTGSRVNTTTYDCTTDSLLVRTIPTPVDAAPAVSGRTKKRKTVTAAVGTLRPAVTVTYQWRRQKKHKTAVAIPGATGPTYKLTGKDVGRKVSVQVTYSRAGNLPNVLVSPARKVH